MFLGFPACYSGNSNMQMKMSIIAVAHVLRKCIEQVKLNDQCQGVAEIKKKTKGCFERVRLCALRGARKF